MNVKDFVCKVFIKLTLCKIVIIFGYYLRDSQNLKVIDIFVPGQVKNPLFLARYSIHKYHLKHPD